mmetsp:Transcript_17871/g.46767  ORF Transcript_17871/g.46767 Transcript_17871/m.46767 type:complete len:244 (+) Transcript_17871:621-1352(+)
MHPAHQATPPPHSLTAVTTAAAAAAAAAAREKVSPVLEGAAAVVGAAPAADVAEWEGVLSGPPITLAENSSSPRTAAPAPAAKLGGAAATGPSIPASSSCTPAPAPASRPSAPAATSCSSLPPAAAADDDGNEASEGGNALGPGVAPAATGTGTGAGGVGAAGAAFVPVDGLCGRDEVDGETACVWKEGGGGIRGEARGEKVRGRLRCGLSSAAESDGLQCSLVPSAFECARRARGESNSGFL